MLFFRNAILASATLLLASSASADTTSSEYVDFARAFDESGAVGVVLQYNAKDASRYVAVIKDRGVARYLGVESPLSSLESTINGTGQTYSGSGTFVGFSRKDGDFSRITVIPEFDGLKIELNKQARRECLYERVSSYVDTLRAYVEPNAACPYQDEVGGYNTFFRSTSVLPGESKNWFFSTLVFNESILPSGE